MNQCIYTAFVHAGPNGSPRHCDWCNYPPRSRDKGDSDHDSLSPENDHLWLQLDSSASSVEEFSAANLTSSSAAPGFSMNGNIFVPLYINESVKVSVSYNFINVCTFSRATDDSIT